MRNDIQFIRGIAILAVLFFHANVFPLSGGYLGVDIFFVISGYLITSIILKEIKNKNFSFIQFYIKRAKRLLPAAYSTLIFATLLSFKILTTEQWHDFIKQLIGTVTFTANFVLPFQTGYFETTSDSKPLLHSWSLSLEEQYYLFIPLILNLVGRKLHLPVLFFLTATSLFICIIFVNNSYIYWRIPSINSQTAAFFLLPTRAWEMLIGSLLAWFMINFPNFNPPNKLKYFSLALIFYLCIFPVGSIHPRESSILTVIATSLLVSGNTLWLNQNRLTQAIQKIGDWSYSLYLVHWPLFALATNAYLGNTPKNVRFFLLFLSLILAFLQYHLIEQKFRYGWQENKTKTLRWLAITSIFVISIPLSADLIKKTDRPKVSMNSESNDACADGDFFNHLAECSTSENPVYAFWGDSYTMHLIPGLKKDKSIASSYIQITKAACAPILGIASIDSNYNEIWARSCLAFNEEAINFIISKKSIRYVIMSSPYSGYFDYGDLTLYYDNQKSISDRSVAIKKMVFTLQNLLEHGIKPILIAPPPRPGFNIGECWERKNSGLLLLGHSDCNFSISEYHAFQRGILDGLNEISERTKLRIFRFDNLLCNEERCLTSINNNISIYKDGGHLSVPGAEWAVPLLRLDQESKMM